MNDYVLIPYYSLTPQSLTVFQRPEYKFISDRQKKTFENLQNNHNKYNELSQHSRKRLQKSINYMLYMSKLKEISGQKVLCKKLKTEIEITKGIKRNTKIKYQITFITLTLSAIQHNTDEEIKSKLLNHFLTDLKRQQKVDLYIWKAEKQENGNIHFHILTNKYIPWQWIRSKWNKIQNKKGFEYVNQYSINMQNFFKNGFKLFENDTRTQAKQFEIYEKNKKENWTNPNSTDIHAIYKIKNIGAYMSKYMSKTVTKTDRVELMKKCYSTISENKKKIELFEDENVFLLENDNTYINNIVLINNLQKEIQEKEKELSEQLKKGVSGRIWGQSQKLSKIKNYTDVESYSDIPDIDIIEKIKRYKSVIEVGTQKILTYYFDINKTPQLKQILNTHIKQSLNNQLI